MIPQLYQQAYQKYLDDYSMKRQALGDVNTQEQNEYAKYLDELNQYNADRNFAYGQYLDDYSRMQSTLAALQGQEQTDYDRYHTGLLEEEDRRRYEDETAYNREQDRLDREYQAQRDALDDEWRQKEFDYGVGRDAVEDEWRQREWDYNLRQDALDRAARAASGSGGSGSSESAENGETQSLIDAMISYGDDARAYEYLVRQGWTQSQIEQMWEFYKTEKARRASEELKNVPNETSGKTPSGRSYVTVEGYGRVTQEDLDEMLARGEVVVIDVDEYGNNVCGSTKKYVGVL